MVDQLTSTYTSSVTASHRRLNSQYFTPANIANIMIEWVSQIKPGCIFDPAFGLGSFYFAAHEVIPSARVAGCEVDDKILSHFNRRHHSLNLDVRLGDYLLTRIGQQQAIVCNPPYGRFQHFENRDSVRAEFQTKLGVRLSGYTNIASAFLIKSLSELQPGGRLAFVMPLEFLNTGYGTLVKERLLDNGKLKALVRFESESEIFPEVITSVGIVLASNDGVSSPIKFYSIKNVQKLDDILEAAPNQSVTKPTPSDKWLKYFTTGPTKEYTHKLVPVNLYGAFTRGIATGANEFFALSPQKATSFGIPRDALLYCISKSNQIESLILTDNELHELERQDANIYLLHANLNLCEPVVKYLQYGERHGYHERFLTKCRTPWYKIEKRLPAPILFGVFSRGRYKVIRNLSSARNLTCFHGFYPNLFGQKYIDALFLYLNSQVARKILQDSLRKYGDGLDKFEPNDLNRALAPSPEWFNRLSIEEVSLGLKSLRESHALAEEIEAIFDNILV